MGLLKTSRAWSLPTQQILRRVLQADPGQEYFVCVPSAGGSDAPLFVTVHGVSRNAHEQARLFSRYAEMRGAVLVAPQFTPAQHSDYQRLGRAGRGLRADLTLDAILEEVAWLTGASAAQIYLFGYSGGAQFAHRYAMAHPHRVARAVVAAAGWYTFPDARTRFPYGIRPSRDLPDLRFDPEEFLRVPIAVLVGEKDTTSEGLRHTQRVDRQQGLTRLERARNWVVAMQDAAAAYQLEPRVTFAPIRGGDHSFSQSMQRSRLGEQVFHELFALPFSWAEESADGRA